MSEIHFLSLFAQAVPIVFAALFPVLNPIGSAIILLPFTSGVDKQTRLLVARKVARNTFALLTGILLVGSYLLSFFGISVPVVEAAGGLVLASMGWKMLNAQDNINAKETGAISAASLLEQTFYPFTFPITMGPGSVAVTLTLSAHTTHPTFVDTLVSQSGAVVSFVALALTVYVAIGYTMPLVKRVGPSGMKVVMRLMAFIILCIGAQICWAGVSALIGQVRA